MARNETYILDEAGSPVLEPNMRKWGAWLKDNRHLASDTVTGPHGGFVSTVFLGLDHSWTDGPPVLWETMVFGGPLSDEQDRYTSREAALAGHAAMLARVVAAAKESA